MYISCCINCKSLVINLPSYRERLLSSTNKPRSILVATKFQDLVLRQSSSAKTLHASTTTTSTHIKRDLKSFNSSQSEVGKIDRSPQQLQHLFKLPASFEVRSAQTSKSFRSQPQPCVQITTFTSTTAVISVSDNLSSQRFTNISKQN